MLSRAARLLPAQGPIGRFVHHNTLHAFEALPFEDAVLAAARLHGAEPFLSEKAFRRELGVGRITHTDLRAELLRDLGSSAEGVIALGLTRLELRQLALLAVEEEDDPHALAWRIAELPAGEAKLWSACVQATRSVDLPDPPSRRLPSMRLRDLLVSAGLGDPDDLVSPFLERLVAAFVDQGIAYWRLPGIERGLYLAARDLLRQRFDKPDPWRKGLGESFPPGDDSTDVILACLDQKGAREAEWEELLAASLLALPGWAGMIHQLELRPDRAPVHAPPARLMDFLALRLVLDAHAAGFVAAQAGRGAQSLAELRKTLAGSVAGEQHSVAAVDRAAFNLFQIAKAAGIEPSVIDELGPEHALAIAKELDAFDDLRR